MEISRSIPCGVKSPGGGGSNGRDLFGRYGSGSDGFSPGFSPGWAGIFMLAALLVLALLCCCCWCCNLVLVIQRWCCGRDRRVKRGGQDLIHLENGNYFGNISSTTVPNNYVDLPHPTRGAIQFKSQENYHSESESHYYQSIDYDKIQNIAEKDPNNLENKSEKKEEEEENLYCEIIDHPIY